MKKSTFLIVLLLLESTSVFPQVAINSGSNAPHGSSILDVSSTTRGFLLPRMTMGELEAIIEPATGLLVYCASDNNFFVNRGTELSPDWTMVNSKWRANGPHIHYLNGNVGIRTPAPSANLHVAETSPGFTGIFGTPIGTYTAGTNVSIGDDDNSAVLTIGQSNSCKGMVGWEYNANPASAYFNICTFQPSFPLILQGSGGRVGICTTGPASNLHVAETPLTYTGVFGTPISTWNFGTNVSIGDNDNSSVLYIGQSTANKGYLIWHHDETPSEAFLSLGTYGNENDLVLQEAGGRIGIGTTNPMSLLDIHSDENSFTNFGYYDIYCQYVFHLEDPLDGTGQAALYAQRYSGNGNEGSGYEPYAINSAIHGYVYCDGGPDQYSFALAGYNPDDYDRCGGVIGSRSDGYVWGSLGYRSSGSTYYGGYFTSYTSGTGKDRKEAATGTGIGAWGDLLGADIHGNIYGTYTEGENYALFSDGAVINNGLEVHLQDNGSATRTVLYTNASTDVTVQTSGIAVLSGGRASVAFDQAFVASISSEVPVVVFAIPAGKSNGIYLGEVSTVGFTVIENDDGKSTVPVNYIAIGRRAGYENPVISPEIIDAGYTTRMTRGLHNDADTKTDGEGLYFENGELMVGIHPSALQKSERPPSAQRKPPVIKNSGQSDLDKKLTGK